MSHLFWNLIGQSDVANCEASKVGLQHVSCVAEGWRKATRVCVGVWVCVWGGEGGDNSLHPYRQKVRATCVWCDARS